MTAGTAPRPDESGRHVVVLHGGHRLRGELRFALVCRFLFGVGEAGAFPNLTKIFTIWLPAAERVRAQGVHVDERALGRCPNAALVVWMLSLMGWRWTFVLFGTVDVVWAVGFYAWFRDNPRDHRRSTSRTCLASGRGGGHRRPRPDAVETLLSSRTVWLLWLQYFCMSYGWWLLYPAGCRPIFVRPVSSM